MAGSVQRNRRNTHKGIHFGGVGRGLKHIDGLYKQPVRAITEAQMKKLCILLKENYAEEAAWRAEMLQRYGVKSRTKLSLIDACNWVDQLEKGELNDL